VSEERSSQSERSEAANDQVTVSQENGAMPPQHVDIHIDRGNPTAEEVAALVTVLGSLAGGTPAPPAQERNRWGLPVSNLRYAVFSWQRVTLMERTYMRR